MGPVGQRIRQKLTTALDPVGLEIVDDSHRHRGHAGHDGAGESHFNVKIVTDRFVGKSRVDRQRLVYRALSDEIEGRVHALSIQALTPDEAQTQGG